MNSAPAKYKFSRLELLSNQSILLIFIIQCVLALMAAIVGANFLFDVNHNHLGEHGEAYCKAKTKLHHESNMGTKIGS
jgi:ABC-type maltose transport system permease subunit